MSTSFAPSLPLLRRRPRRTLPLLAVALVPGTAARADAVPVVSATDAQDRLVGLGLLPRSAATGSWNRPTVDAIRCYQATVGLEPSGVVGTTTAQRLLDARA